MSAQAGNRLLLGYVAGPAGAVTNLQVYGLSASGLDDNREVLLQASGRRRAKAVIPRQMCSV